MSFMRILHLSDTHDLHHHLKNLPEADIIVHSGNFTMTGSTNEIIEFLNWFCNLPYAHKFFIAGNHDMNLYNATISGPGDNCHYLCNSGINIDDIKFYGVPMFMEDSMNGHSGMHCPFFSIFKVHATFQILRDNFL